MATAVFVVLILASLVLAAQSARGRKRNDIREFVIASRQFGALLLFFLAAGEIYGIGTMTGFPGGIYAKGPGYGIWFLGYILLAYPVGYFINPLIWRAGQAYKAVTLPDLFRGHFGSRALELTVATTAIISLIPWGQLQFTGLIVVLNGLGWRFNPWLLVSIAAVLAFSYIVISGIRAPAFVSILKDILMILALVMCGVAAATAEGVGPIFLEAGRHVPSKMTAGEQTFAMTTMVVQSLGFYVIPFTIQILFTARSEETIRRTQIVMPLYMLMFPFLVVAAYYSLAHIQNLPSPNQALMAVVDRLLPNWLVGVVAAGATLSGLIVLAGLCLAIGPIVSRNLIPNIPEAHQRRGSQVVIVVYLLISIVLTLGAPTLMLNLINVAYYGFCQFVPGVFTILFARKASPYAVLAGIVFGDLLALALEMLHVNVGQINIGLICLVCNALIVVVGNKVFATGRNYVPATEYST